MAKQYNKSDIKIKCGEALKNPSLFYAQGFVNYRGICPDVGIPYTEVVAEFLCDHLDEYIAGIQKISRKNSYYTPTHDGSFNPASNREEEIIAMKMYCYSKDGGQYAHIGRILDYQTPLKDEPKDKAGKLDLLAINGTALRILELKRPNTGETMLRCVLEGFTYLRTLDAEKLIADFNKDGMDISIPENAIMKSSAFVFENSRPHKEYLRDCPNLKKLMQLLDSKPFFIRTTQKGFEVLD